MIKTIDWHFNKAEGIAYRYTVDDNMGIVVCYIKPMSPSSRPDYMDICRDDLFLELYLEMKMLSHKSSFHKSIHFKDSENEAKGIAKCHDNDKFDEEVGKKIAYYRAYNKFMTRRKNKVATVIAELNDMQKDAKEVYNMLRCKLARNEVRLEEYIK